MRLRYLFFTLFLLGFCTGLGAQQKLDIDFETGDDNLERMEFQENPEVSIRIRGRADLTKTNINRGITWPDRSVRRVTINLPDSIVLSDLQEIQISRRPVYNRKYAWDYLKKDNWNLKALTVTATLVVNGAKKQFLLLDLHPGDRVFRFVYEGGDNVREGTVFKAKLELKTTQTVKQPQTENAVLTAYFATGNDNLEGGNDNNVDLLLKFKDSPTVILAENLNKRTTWNNNSERTITYEIPQSALLNIENISRVQLRHTGGGGTFADNWNLSKFRLVISKAGQEKVLVNLAGNPLHRFTGDERVKEFIVAGQNAQDVLANARITAVFGTGSDNLEGGSTNNVNLIIRIRNSSSAISLSNINKGVKWGNNTIITITDREVPLSANLNIEDILEVELRHTGGGGIGADNWNLDKFKLIIKKGDQTRVLVDKSGAPIHRFTGETRSKKFRVNESVSVQ